MKPTKAESDTSPEYQRFENMLKKVLAVTPGEMKRRVTVEKKAKPKRHNQTSKPSTGN